MTSAKPPGSIQRLAFVGNHLPRRCGIATFTSDLSATVARVAPDIESMVVAMNDTGCSHAYPEIVRFEIAEGEVAGYRRAGQFLNANYVDVVSLAARIRNLRRQGRQPRRHACSASSACRS